MVLKVFYLFRDGKDLKKRVREGGLESFRERGVELWVSIMVLNFFSCKF